MVTVSLSGNGFGHEVIVHRVWLVLGWVTVREFTGPFNQKSIDQLRPGLLSVVRRNEYWQWQRHTVVT